MRKRCSRDEGGTKPTPDGLTRHVSRVFRRSRRDVSQDAEPVSAVSSDDHTRRTFQNTSPQRRPQDSRSDGNEGVTWVEEGKKEERAEEGAARTRRERGGGVGGGRGVRRERGCLS